MLKNILSLFLVVVLLIGGCNQNQGTCPIAESILKERDPALFLENMKETLDVITLQENVVPVGSSKYASQPYPGDVDLFELAAVNKPKAEAAQYFADRIKNVAQQVLLHHEIFFSDFKAGTDQRLKIDVGSSSQIGTFTGYDAAKIRQDISSLQTQGLISAQEATALIDGVKDNPSYLEWSALKEEFRLLYTIRWTASELIAQQKTLRGGLVLKLVDALENSLVKIDVIAPVNINGYTEVTDFYSLRYFENGVEKELTNPLGDYAELLREDILTYSNTILGRNSLKTAKRMWILAALLKDYGLLATLTPLVQSDAAALNQVVAQAEAIDRLLTIESNVLCPVGSIIGAQMESFDKRISNHSDIAPSTLATILDPVYNAVAGNCPESIDVDGIALNASTRDSILKAADDLSKLLKPIVEQKADAYLKSVGIDLDRPLEAFTGNIGVCPV